jgi:hypothetical protein
VFVFAQVASATSRLPMSKVRVHLIDWQRWAAHTRDVAIDARSEFVVAPGLGGPEYRSAVHLPTRPRTNGSVQPRHEVSSRA